MIHPILEETSLMVLDFNLILNHIQINQIDHVILFLTKIFQKSIINQNVEENGHNIGAVVEPNVSINLKTWLIILSVIVKLKANKSKQVYNKLKIISFKSFKNYNKIMMILLEDMTEIFKEED
jgi:hypothetical protein